MNRCQVMVSSSGRRDAGQCRKTTGIKHVTLADVEVPICTAHRRVIEEGRAMARVTLGRRR